jgi:hypothetical protein
LNGLFGTHDAIGRKTVGMDMQIDFHLICL